MVLAWLINTGMAWLLFSGLKTAVSQGTVQVKPNVTLTKLGGETSQGTLLSADSSRVSIQNSSGTVESRSNDISVLSFTNKVASQTQPVEVVMLDGSKTYGDSLAGKSNSWRLQNSTGNAIEIPPKAIRAALFKPLPVELKEAWQLAIKETVQSDAVIVQRPGNVLDRINGIIVQIQEANVAFELDGEQIQIPLEKMLGLVWFQRPLDRIKPSVEITTTNRSVWMAESFSTTENSLDLKTQTGVSVLIPLSSLMNINYSTANIRWLAELEVLEATVNKRLEFSSPIASLERSLAPRFIAKGQTRGAFVNSADQDLLFPSPGKLVLRIPEGFTALQSVVQRTDAGNQRTEITIEVWQDDQRIAEQLLPFDKESVEINVPVQAGKKVMLAVACSSKLMIGTEVQWKQPRLKR